MSYSRKSSFRYSCSLSPHGRYDRSISRSISRSLSRSRSPSRSRDSSEVENPGNNLYVTGLSARTTKKELEKHFSSEGGMVVDSHLVADPWTRESRGFGFVTMSTVKEADYCLKYLNQSVLEGRVITVEKARRRRGRTPTPGRFLGPRTIHVRRRSPSYSPYYRSRHSSPCYSSEWDRDRSYSPRSHRRFHSPYSRSPVARRDRSYYPYHSRHYSPEDRSISPYYRSHNRHTSGSILSRARSFRRSYSRSLSPWARRSTRRSLRRSYSRSLSPRPRSYSRSVSPRPRRSSRRSYSRSVSPRLRRSSRRRYSRSVSPRLRRSYSHESYSRSCSLSSRSRSPSSASP